MLAAFTTLLGLIPVIGPWLSSGLTAIVGKYFDSKVAIETARVGGARDIAVANIQSRVSGLAVIAGSTLLSLLVIAFAAPLVAFMFKVVVWDLVVGSFKGCADKKAVAECITFSTDPIKGQVADWANTIIVSLFGSTTVIASASMFRRTP